MGAVEALGALCPGLGLILGGVLVSVCSPRVAFAIVGTGAALTTIAFARVHLDRAAASTAREPAVGPAAAAADGRLGSLASRVRGLRDVVPPAPATEDCPFRTLPSGPLRTTGAVLMSRSQITTRLFWSAELLALLGAVALAVRLSNAPQWHPLLLVAILLALALIGDRVSSAIGNGVLSTAHTRDGPRDLSAGSRPRGRLRRLGGGAHLGGAPPVPFGLVQQPRCAVRLPAGGGLDRRADGRRRARPEQPSARRRA